MLQTLRLYQNGQRRLIISVKHVQRASLDHQSLQKPKPLLESHQLNASVALFVLNAQIDLLVSGQDLKHLYLLLLSLVASGKHVVQTRPL